MLNFNNFSLILFFISLVLFMFIFSSFINFILLSEISWISLYLLLVGYTMVSNSLLYLVWGMLLLVIAASDSCMGLMLIMVKYILYGMFNDVSHGYKNRTTGFTTFI